MVMGLVNPEYGALNYILEYSKEMLKWNGYYQL
jgi:hypothetical protein